MAEPLLRVELLVDKLLVELRKESRPVTGDTGGDRGDDDILGDSEISAGGKDVKRSSISMIESSSSRISSISSMGNIGVSFARFLSSCRDASGTEAFLL